MGSRPSLGTTAETRHSERGTAMTRTFADRYAEAVQEGANARRNGDTIDDNPYVPAPLQRAWRSGFQRVAAR